MDLLTSRSRPQDAKDNIPLLYRSDGFLVWVQVESAGSLCLSVAHQLFTCPSSIPARCLGWLCLLLVPACASLALNCRSRLCGSATDRAMLTGMSQPGLLPTDTLACTGECHAGLWRQGRSASCGDSRQSSMRCPVQGSARERTLTGFGPAPFVCWNHTL